MKPDPAQYDTANGVHGWCAVNVTQENGTARIVPVAVFFTPEEAWRWTRGVSGKTVMRVLVCPLLAKEKTPEPGKESQ